jgi:hypothetical protein
MSKRILTQSINSSGSEEEEGKHDRQQRQLRFGDRGFQWDGL